MPLIIPRLDDRTWEQLSEEARLLIPSLAPEWTNHNASDPGITLLELFAFYCETFLFRLDQISDDTVHSFLKLINGRRWQRGQDVTQDIRSTMLGLQQPHRAVAPEDYERLAESINGQLGPEARVRVARVKCVPRHDLRQPGAAADTDEPGHISLVVLPDPPDADTTHLFRRLHELVEGVRMITTRVHILRPRFVEVGVRLSLTTEQQFSTAEVRREALSALSNFLSPLRADGRGWPFGRGVYVSEIYNVLMKLPGVRTVRSTPRPG